MNAPLIQMSEHYTDVVNAKIKDFESQISGYFKGPVKVVVIGANGSSPEMQVDIYQCIDTAVQHVFNTTLEELKKTGRKQYQSDIRMMIVYILRKHTLLSFNQIANFFNRHHSTIIYLKDRHEEYSEIDRRYRAKWLKFEQIFNAAIQKQLIITKPNHD